VPAAAADFAIRPTITQQQFEEFTAVVGQAIYASPVEPATARGFLAFDIGIAATAMPVDEDAAYWVNAVQSDILTSGYLPVPRLVVSKGLSVATIAGSYARIPSTDVEVWGGSLDVPILRGSLVAPSLSIRGAYSEIRGIEELELKTYGAELFLSKAFGPVTPYGAVGVARYESQAWVPEVGAMPRVLNAELEKERLTLGLRISLLFPKLVIEGTRSDDWAYSAKFSFGF
jgi:hypothetical protein